MKKLFLLIILVLINFTFAVAHQPKLIKYSPSLNKPHKVIEPEISKAYYGKLNGEPHYYKIESNVEFSFYAGITIPKIDENVKWISLEVYDQNNNLIFNENGKEYSWKAWYEPYARDWYWIGPQVGKHNDKQFKDTIKLKAGSYIIKVLNEDNKGSYSLAVGNVEFFGSNLTEKIYIWTPILFYIGPYMDIFYWNKFDFKAYIPHLILLILIYIFYFFIKKIFFKKKIIE
tara:strand:+ start:122 stop:811 length:690 start_codon:yes stop_codon:yes gene_type:complete